MRPRFASSGDLRADRRYDYAMDLLAGGDAAAAIDVLSQALELAPQWAAGWFALGEAAEQAGRPAEAKQAFGRALAIDAADALGAGLRIAALGGEVPSAMPRAYVRALFDDYASRFEQALTEGLGYRGPEVLLAALQAAAADLGRPFVFGRALDLGCGTGLMGAAIRPHVGTLGGIDLSERMVAQARAKGVYDRLAVADVSAALAAEPAASLDLVLAADVFVYLGDLAPVLAAVRRALAPGGLAGFTVERNAGPGVALGRALRYLHGEPHIRAAAQAAGLAVVRLDAASTRSEAGAPVPGLVAVLTPAGE